MCTIAECGHVPRQSHSGDRMFDRHHCGGSDPVVAAHHRGNLTGFHPLAPNLHLIVDASQILQKAIGIPSGQIARPVHATTRPPWVGDKAPGRQPGAAVVTARQLHARHVQFADDTCRYSPQPRIQHHGSGVGERTPDRKGPVRVVGAGVELAEYDLDRRFGRSVDVPCPHTESRVEVTGKRHRHRFAAQRQNIGRQLRQGALPQHLLHERRGEVDPGEVIVVQQLSDVRRVGELGVIQIVHNTTEGQRPEQLCRRRIETDCGSRHHDITGSQFAEFLATTDQLTKRPVRDVDPFGSPGGARGVHHIDRVVGMQSTRAFVIADGRRIHDVDPRRHRWISQIKCVGVAVHRAIVVATGGDQHRSAAVFDQEPDSFEWVGGVDGDKRGAGTHHRGHCKGQLRAPVDQDRHTVPDLDAGSDQVAGQPVDTLIELHRGVGLSSEDQRRFRRTLTGGGLEHGVNGRVLGSQVFAASGILQRHGAELDSAQRLVRSVDHHVEDRGEHVDETVDGGRCVQLGGVRDTTRQNAVQHLELEFEVGLDGLQDTADPLEMRQAGGLEGVVSDLFVLGHEVQQHLTQRVRSRNPADA